MKIKSDGALDFLSLGALVHRLDPGIIPFRKATECKIHVSGGEFNVAANLADCFGMRTGIASAMVEYRIDLDHAQILRFTRGMLRRPQRPAEAEMRQHEGAGCCGVVFGFRGHLGIAPPDGDDLKRKYIYVRHHRACPGDPYGIGAGFDVAWIAGTSPAMTVELLLDSASA